jgi:predicted alpha/beta-hydrolase family hydrolase
MRHAAENLSARGIQVVTFDFPYMAAGRKLPDKAPVLEQAFINVWAKAAANATGPMFAAGKSMGGRMASMVAARQAFTPAPAGLVFFGYPLHPPTKPTQRRDAHLPAITVPMLFVHGTKDAFGTPEEMTALATGLPFSTLALVDGGDHSLVIKRGRPVEDRWFDLVATWMVSQTGD